MKAIVIDDVEKFRSDLMTLIAKVDDLEVVGQAEGVKAGKELIEKVKFDLLFLDVEMEDGSGFDLLDLMPQKNFDVVFVTAHGQYAMQAIRYSAFDYLLKPVSEDAFLACLERIRTKEKRPAELRRQVETLRSNLNGKQDLKIALPTMDEIYYLQLTDIVRVEASGSYTEVHLSDGRKILVSKNLKVLEEYLDFPVLVRVHKSHLINLDHITRFVKTGGGMVELTGGHMVEVSRRKKDALLELLNSRY